MKTSVLLMLIGGAAMGSMFTYFVIKSSGPVVYAQPDVAAQRRPLKVALYRYELKPDKLDRFDDWIQFEHTHHAETVETLEREKMYFEAIFRDRENQKDVIYWLAINGEGGSSVDSSPLEIDKQYEAFMHETLKKNSSRALSTEYFLIPEFVMRAIDQHQAAAH
jgi:Family of unknown function (DUF6176)